MSDQVNLLPPNATPTEISVDESVDLALALDARLQTLWDPLYCPEHLLPWLAWAYSVDVWRSEWDEKKRRIVLANALAAHRQKGTVAAVKQAVAALGSRVHIIEWFEPQGSGDPYTVDLQIYVGEILNAGAELISAELMADLVATIHATAPARVHFTIEIGVDFSVGWQCAGALNRPVQMAGLQGLISANQGMTARTQIASALQRPAQLVSVSWEEQSNA
jgi:phage tail P2-like protein